MADQPLFPLGFYHVSWARAGSVKQRQTDLRRMAQAGFNVMATEPIDDADAAQFTTVLKEAGAAGIFVIAGGLAAADARRIAAAPALLALKVADDANTQYTPGEVRRRAASARQATPQKQTYISLAVGLYEPERAYFAAADLVGNQSYPVGREHLIVTYRTMVSAVQSARQGGSVPVANLQAFGWPGAPGPTPAELRNMTYQALMAGAQGILYYAYRSPEVDLNGEPQLWAELRRLAGEIAELSPTFLNGNRRELLAGTTPAVILNGPTDLLIIANTTRQSQRARMDLPARPGSWKALRSGAPDLHSGVTQVQLAPLQVLIYQSDGFQHTP